MTEREKRKARKARLALKIEARRESARVATAQTTFAPVYMPTRKKPPPSRGPRRADEASRYETLEVRAARKAIVADKTRELMDARAASRAANKVGDAWTMREWSDSSPVSIIHRAEPYEPGENHPLAQQS
jgi:hypothetical protein